MDGRVVVKSLTQVARQMLQGLDEILQAISVLEDLPAARSEAESVQCECCVPGVEGHDVAPLDAPQWLSQS